MKTSPLCKHLHVHVHLQRIYEWHFVVGYGLDPCPPAWQTGPLPTELTRWLLAQSQG